MNHIIEALASAGRPRSFGLPHDTVVEWTDEAERLTYTGRVLTDYEHGTTIRVESVRLASGPYATWIGAAHRERVLAVLDRPDEVES